MEEQLQQLQSELDSARAMALKMMSANSEMGQITHFLKRSFAAADYAQLGTDLLEYLANQGLHASISIADSSGRLFYTLDKDNGMLDESLLARYAEAGRLVEIDSRLVVNYEHCSLLIDNVPDDEQRKGELRDNLAILMDGVEARAQALAAEQQLAEVHKAKEAFFSLMSHELRTPLNPIIGYATRLHSKLNESLKPRDAEALLRIREHGEHLLRQINDILEFLRVQSGSIKLHPERSNIKPLVLRSIQELQPLIDANKVVVDASAIADEIQHYADPARLHDIIVGLLSNAVKYSPNGTVKIQIDKADECSSGAAGLVINFVDDGAGIAGAGLERIFHHFTEREPPISNSAISPGASLFLVRELVRLHGGEIKVSSRLGQGSQFQVRLPGSGLAIQ